MIQSFNAWPGQIPVSTAGTARPTRPCIPLQRQIHQSIRLLYSTEATEDKSADEFHSIITDSETAKGFNYSRNKIQTWSAFCPYTQQTKLPLLISRYIYNSTTSGCSVLKAEVNQLSACV